MRLFHALPFLVMILLSPGAFAVIETYEFSAPELEQRYQDLSAELRCPKCQNQNIADSNAPIAQDLRKQLHLQLEAGSSDNEIKEFMVSRYGEFVLYRPRLSGATVILWLAPALLLGCAALVVFMSLRRRSSTPDGGELSDQEQARLKSMLKDTEDGN